MKSREVVSLAVLALVSSSFAGSQTQVAKIDRYSLVTRHNYTLTSFSGDRPVQVGNGEFAFGMDATGLQSFVPFNTMSHWGWRSVAPPLGQSPKDFEGQVWDTHGRPVRYPMEDPNHPELSAWLAGNPHRINLGRIGFMLAKKDGSPATQADIQHPRQTVDLWNGIVSSRFEIDGQPVSVTTACHPSIDSVAVRVESPLIAAGHLAVFLNCPGDNLHQFDNFVGDAGSPGKLEMLKPLGAGRANLVRRLGEDSYYVSLNWPGKARLQSPPPSNPLLTIVKAEYGAEGHWLDVTGQVAKMVREGRLNVRVDNGLGADPDPGKGKSLKVTYRVEGKIQSVEAAENEDLIVDSGASSRQFTLHPTGNSNSFSFTCAFSHHPLSEKLPDCEATLSACRLKWPEFWRRGGAIDLSGSRDPRWKELERRIVLSQYLMAVNEAGAYPPQESGLVNNGWFGRFHMEMYWWHAAHWALWNRWPQLDRSLGVYSKFLPKAEEQARSEGYLGARWPKCVGPNDREWPHVIHSLLIWQQPHPLFFAELDYRAHPTRATLDKWKAVVEKTADFLASYAFFDPKRKQYVLGPPLVLASENTDPKTTQNPTFELGYWRFGLRIAQQWRHRLGLRPNPIWARVAKGLSPLPEQDGLYVLHEGVKDMWTHWNFEHPALTAVLGVLPGDGVDPTTMRRTLDKVNASWDFNHTWGWDFPMLAMCAARVGEPDRAIDFLLHPAGGFQFDERGLATGGPFPYFPSNGGLLYAVAMLAAGWDGAPKRVAPGFPANGQWKVRVENISRAP